VSHSVREVGLAVAVTVTVEWAQLIGRVSMRSAEHCQCVSHDMCHMTGVTWQWRWHVLWCTGEHNSSAVAVWYMSERVSRRRVSECLSTDSQRRWIQRVGTFLVARSVSSCCVVVYCGFGSVSVLEYDSLSVIIYLHYIQHDHTFIHLVACNFTQPLYISIMFAMQLSTAPPASISGGDWPFSYVAAPLTRRAASSALLTTIHCDLVHYTATCLQIKYERVLALFADRSLSLSLSLSLCLSVCLSVSVFIALLIVNWSQRWADVSVASMFVPAPSSTQSAPWPSPVCIDCLALCHEARDMYVIYCCSLCPALISLVISTRLSVPDRNEPWAGPVTCWESIVSVWRQRNKRRNQHHNTQKTLSDRILRWFGHVIRMNHAHTGHRQAGGTVTKDRRSMEHAHNTCLHGHRLTSTYHHCDGSPVHLSVMNECPTYKWTANWASVANICYWSCCQLRRLLSNVC